MRERERERVRDKAKVKACLGFLKFNKQNNSKLIISEVFGDKHKYFKW